MPDEKYREIFSNRLNHYMRERGKRQQDLIDDLGLSSATVSSWVNGLRLPRMGKIQMLADYLKIDTTDLLEEKDNQLDNITSHLISKFSQLTPANQTTVMGMIDLLLSQQSSESKKTAICV